MYWGNSPGVFINSQGAAINRTRVTLVPGWSWACILKKSNTRPKHPFISSLRRGTCGILGFCTIIDFKVLCGYCVFLLYTIKNAININRIPKFLWVSLYLEKNVTKCIFKYVMSIMASYKMLYAARTFWFEVDFETVNLGLKVSIARQ